ncbi:hypothetical protein GCM10010524_61150 [Streptomyces mexicanus]
MPPIPQAGDGPVRTRWYEAPTARHSLGNFTTVHPDEPRSVTVVVALYHPTLGAAIGIGIVVVTLLNELMGRKLAFIRLPRAYVSEPRTATVRVRLSAPMGELSTSDGPRCRVRRMTCAA